METIVIIVLWVLAVYLVCGFVFAICFLSKGITAVDEIAKGSSTGFRLIILPGVILFWPLLLKKWINALHK